MLDKAPATKSVAITTTAQFTKSLTATLEHMGSGRKKMHHLLKVATSRVINNKDVSWLTAIAKAVDTDETTPLVPIAKVKAWVFEAIGVKYNSGNKSFNLTKALKASLDSDDQRKELASKVRSMPSYWNLKANTTAKVCLNGKGGDEYIRDLLTSELKKLGKASEALAEAIAAGTITEDDATKAATQNEVHAVALETMRIALNNANLN